MTLDLSVSVQNCSTAPGFSTRFAPPRHRMVVPQSVLAPKDRVKSSFVSHHVEMGCFHNFAIHKTMIEIGLNTWDASIIKACSWAPIRWNIRNMFLVPSLGIGTCWSCQTFFPSPISMYIMFFRLTIDLNKQVCFSPPFFTGNASTLSPVSKPSEVQLIGSCHQGPARTVCIQSHVAHTVEKLRFLVAAFLVRTRNYGTS